MVKLTHLAKAAGWAAKISPEGLNKALSGLDIFRDERVLVSFETSDDAGVFKLDEDKYIVQTVDFITPVCDDPFTFGRISAINSLSDIYAMGGEPLTALSILMYNCDIDESIISTMMQGACEEFKKVNCSLIGGHTVDDSEVKLGFAITGIIKDGKIFKNVGLRVGDKLIYTKPLGIGILSTAVKGEIATEYDIKNVNEIMLKSNYEASKLLRRYDVSACTDITGFGLGGHLLEMAKGSNKSVYIYIDNIKLISNTLKYSGMGIIPAGAYYNKQFFINDFQFNHNNKDMEIVIFDPQTSGGLMFAVSENDADEMLKELIAIGYNDSSIVGEVTELADSYLLIK